MQPCCMLFGKSNQPVNLRIVSKLVPTVRACDNNLEAVSVLTLVGCQLYCDGSSPQGALVVSGARWVGAVVLVWVDTRITLNVEIEGLAAVGLITF